MNWKFEAIDKLKGYMARKNAISSIPMEIARLKDDCGRIRSVTSDATSVQGGSSTREDRLLSNIALRQELELRLKDARRWVAVVDKALAVLNDEERLVLDRFYINTQRGGISRLCDELGLLDESSVYRRKAKALRNFAIALYGVTES